MAGSAILGTNLVDSLVGVIDDIRGQLHPSLGVRRFRVYTVTRTYGGERGVAPFTDVLFELDPQPKVENYVTYTTIRTELEPCGIDEAGMIILTEISLTHTEAELVGPPADPMQQDFFYKLTDAHGQSIRDRYFQPVSPPYPDVSSGMGFCLKLIPMAAPEAP